MFRGVNELPRVLENMIKVGRPKEVSVEVDGVTYPNVKITDLLKSSDDPFVVHGDMTLVWREEV